MSLDEPISSGVGPEVQEAIKEALSGLFANLTSVIESRLSGFKRDLVASGVIPRSRQLRGTKSSSNRRAMESSSSISSKFLIALLMHNIPWPTLSTRRRRELSKEVCVNEWASSEELAAEKDLALS